MSKKNLNTFNEEDALKILTFLREKNKKAAVEVYVRGRRALLFIPDAMAMDKEDWLRRKRNSVLYFGLSTQALLEKQNGDEGKIMSKYGKSLEDYTFTPGSIPIILNDIGMIGALSITGLLPEEDHELAVWLMEKLIEEKSYE